MKNSIYEIERKFLITYPEQSWLERCQDKSEIVQTYLTSVSGETARVRSRRRNGSICYTHTVKKKVTDIRRIEEEREITEAEYLQLLEMADPRRNAVIKTRYCYEYKNQLFEIDVYPFWTDRAVMEIELDDESQEIDFPPEIDIIREITADKRYTNASLALQIPQGND